METIITKHLKPTKMRKVLSKLTLLLAISTATLTACKKDRESVPPPPPTGNYAIKVKASVTVGDVVYDSIPATITIASWDSKGTLHQREAQLAAGANIIYLPKAHTKYTIRMSKWGVTDERTIMSNQVSETTTYTLGGSKAAKKLREEVSYQFQDGSYQLNRKLLYLYDGQGRLQEIQNFFADANHPSPHLELYSVDRFIYHDGRLDRVETVDKKTAGEPVSGSVDYLWNLTGQIVALQYGTPGNISESRVEYLSQDNHELVRVNLFNDNMATGSRIDLKFAGGNRVEEKTVIPNHATQTRTFSYDGNINPYVHMKWPRLQFAGLSKNNVVEERLDFAAAYMRNEYTYDADGYVKEVVKREINGNTSETRAMVKTIFTY